MKFKQARFPMLYSMPGATTRSLEQVTRIVRITELSSSEARELAKTFGHTPHILGNDWGQLEQSIQDDSVLAFGTVVDERLESLSLSSINGRPCCIDPGVKEDFNHGVYVQQGKPPQPISAEDGLLQVVWVEPKAQRRGIGGAHLLAQLCALEMHGCPRAWSLFSMTEGRDGVFWDRTWNHILASHGFMGSGPLGHRCETSYPMCHGKFHAMCMEL